MLSKDEAVWTAVVKTHGMLKFAASCPLKKCDEARGRGPPLRGGQIWIRARIISVLRVFTVYGYFPRPQIVSYFIDAKIFQLVFTKLPVST